MSQGRHKHRLIMRTDSAFPYPKLEIDLTLITDSDNNHTTATTMKDSKRDNENIAYSSPQGPIKVHTHREI